ncbi:MAG TPA: hypothetical protein VN132_05985 [Bdellovibrio sp.]|nr:hypothetical protein [Bdellovibrio sp.]
MKLTLATLILITASSAFARLDKNCSQLATTEAKKLALAQNKESANQQDKSFNGLLALMQKQAEAENDLIDKVAKECIEMKTEAGEDVSESKAQDIQRDVDTLVNSQVGMLHHGSDGK